jgi:SpoIID/LytB domain protein
VLYNGSIWHIYGGDGVKRRIFVFILALFFTLSTTAFAYQNSSYSRDLRIGLESMTSTSISVSLNGSYTADGKRFADGSSFTLKITNGKIDFNGILYNEITFMPENKENTIRLSVGAQKYNYLGSMTFKVQSGKILPINTIDIESYLKGVVAYEMSNSFPLEALKAQAVAARNYALSNVDKHRSEGYDLCDTIDCQVYRGYNPYYSNVIKAVDDTKGMVLLYNEKLANTYYSASNGGYTEASGNIWSQQLPYLIIKKDDFESENWPYGDRIMTGLDIDIALKSKGLLLPTDSFVRIDIENIQRNMSGRVSRIDVIYRDVNGVEKRKTFTKEGPRTFLSLPSTFYNVIYDPSTNTYVFSGKGYGHGVGMSQIGAKNRANAGHTYDQILSFYYDGTYLFKLEDERKNDEGKKTEPRKPEDKPPVTSKPSNETTQQTSRVLYLGMKGEDVKLLQQKLKALGYNIQDPDGVFGPATLSAVKDFQKKNNLTIDGIVGKATATIIDNKISSINKISSEKVATLPSRGQAPLNQSYFVAQGLKKGMKGTEVKKLQEVLIRLSFLKGKADGAFGTLTESAVKAFQKANKLKVSGIVDAQTAALINNKISSINNISSQKVAALPSRGQAPSNQSYFVAQGLKKGMKGTEVKKLQEALIRLSFLKGKADGAFGTLTESAVKAFQKANGLKVSGIVDAQTANKINQKIR